MSMKVNMELGLKDVPGSLLKAMEPISKHGGNIVSVLHHRGETETVEVKIVFRIKDMQSLKFIQRDLEKRTKITSINVEGKKYYEKKTLTFILVGHVIDSDIRDTIDRINEVGCVSDIDVIMPDPLEKSSVLMKADVDNGDTEELTSVVNEICEKKNLEFIKSLEN